MKNTDTYPTEGLNQATPLWLVFIVASIITSLLVAIFLMTISPDASIAAIQAQSISYGLAWGLFLTSLTRTTRLTTSSRRPLNL